MGMEVMVAMVAMVVTASMENMVKRRDRGASLLVRMMEAGVSEVLDVRLWQSYCCLGYLEFGK